MRHHSSGNGSLHIADPDEEDTDPGTRNRVSMVALMEAMSRLVTSVDGLKRVVRWLAVGFFTLAGAGLLMAALFWWLRG